MASAQGSLTGARTRVALPCAGARAAADARVVEWIPAAHVVTHPLPMGPNNACFVPWRARRGPWAKSRGYRPRALGRVMV